MKTKYVLKRITAFVLALTLTTLLAVTAAAAEARGSTLIVSHSCTATADGDGDFHVTFSITGKKVMSRIGAESMYIYVKNGGMWVLEESYGKYSTGMSATNRLAYGNTIDHQGREKAEYKIVVTLFVEDSTGATDSRDYTKYVNT